MIFRLDIEEKRRWKTIKWMTIDMGERVDEAVKEAVGSAAVSPPRPAN